MKFGKIFVLVGIEVVSGSTTLGPDEAAPAQAGAAGGVGQLQTDENQSMVEPIAKKPIAAISKSDNYFPGIDLEQLRPAPDLLDKDSSPPTRMSYMYLDNILVPLRPYLRRFVLERIAVDIENTKSTPQFSLDGEYSRLGVRSLRVGEPIANRYETVIMTLSEFHDPYYQFSPRDVLIKYQGNCHSLVNGISAIHPLITEEFFLYEIERLVEDRRVNSQITPKILFVSPPALLRPVKSVKTDFIMSTKNRQICTASKASVRYMIMERGGASLERLMAVKNFSFIDGMRILLQLFSMLEIVHTGGFIHGDIHRGNVVESRTNPEKFWLIDFGMARYVSPSEAPPIRPVGALPNSLSTHWVLEGIAPSYRDDAMQAMMTVATIVGGKPYLDQLRAAEQNSNRAGLIERYRDGNIFQGMAISEKGRASTVQLLDAVRGLRYAEPVDFASLIAYVDEIIKHEEEGSMETS